MEKIFKKINKDKKLRFLAIIAILFIIAGIFTGLYTETTFKLGNIKIENKPYSDWTPPLIIAGLIISVLVIYFVLSKK